MTQRASAWARLPGELKALPQWVLAGADKAPLSIDAQGKLFNTRVTRPSEWLTFDQACQAAWDRRDEPTTHQPNKGPVVMQVGYDIGYILNEADPFTCIDLDIKDASTAPDNPELWTTAEDYDRFMNIVRFYDSYTERSRSGKGMHIWLHGNIGRGFRRDGVEIYSQERFIICTGDVLLDRPIAHKEVELQNTVSQMRPLAKAGTLEELEPLEEDWTILERAVTAANRDKFLPLWEGRWQDLGFPSQSEADLALMSMFTFYSDSNEQCRRLFRWSALGKREKALKDNRYVDFTLTTIRDRQARENAADLSGIRQAAEFKQSLVEKAIMELQGGAPLSSQALQPDKVFSPQEQRHVVPLHVPGQGNPPPAPPPPEIALASLAPVSASVVEIGKSGLPWPPGFTGLLAQYIYQSAPRPVKEVAIVAALGLLAGIAGKAWHIPKSGLNLYIILIAKSGVGKEAMHSGISEIIKACTRENPAFHKFVDFTEYASGPALIKGCVANPCFVNVSGEWGRRLKRLAQEDGRDGALQTLRTQMTNLYQKSGPQAIVGGIGYSTQDNNVASVAGVSYSMIGETTPSTFYEALTESMMEDGFLSRFTIVEYEGLRPRPNENALHAPDENIRKWLNGMALQADLMIARDGSQLIERDEAASSILRAFESECDDQINNTLDESRRQMWNRAALKAQRIAGLLAVADNYMTPCIRVEHIEWAIRCIRTDIFIMGRRLDSGDVGSGDIARERKMMSLLKEYLTKPVPESYKVPDAMRQNNIVPRNYLQVRIGRAASFSNHKLGANRALEDTIHTAIANGYLMEVDKSKIVEAYGYHGKSYRVLKIPDYAAESLAS